MAEIKLTKSNFKEEVLDSSIPVLVDFWATWCGPCMMLGPVIKEIADDYDGRLKVGKINVDEQDELATEFRIMTIPALMLFKDGKVAARTVGYSPKAELKSWIDQEI